LLLAPQACDCYFFGCKHGACPPADFLEVSIFLPAVDSARLHGFTISKLGKNLTRHEIFRGKVSRRKNQK